MAASAAQADFGDGRLHLRWHALPKRRLAPLDILSLRVSFSRKGHDGARPRAVQRRFDMAARRGGGQTARRRVRP